MRTSALVLSCLTKMHREKVLKNIFLILRWEAQLCLPQFQQRRADTRHVEWVCRLWAVCQGKVRVPILYPDLSAQLLHVFCQCFAVQRNPKRIVLIAVIATLPYSPRSISQETRKFSRSFQSHFSNTADLNNYMQRRRKKKYSLIQFERAASQSRSDALTTSS